MFNFLKKSCLLAFLTGGVLSSVSAMESFTYFSTKFNQYLGSSQENAALRNALERAKASKFQEEDWKSIIECVKRGANPNTQIEGTPLITFAIQYGKEELFHTLLEKDANVNAQNDFGLSPLHFAAAYNKADFIKPLITHGANVNAKANGNKTPLCSALTILPGKDAKTDEMIKFNETIKELCNNGASLDKLDNDKNTVFHMIITLPREIVEKIMTSTLSLPYNDNDKDNDNNDKTSMTAIFEKITNMPKSFEPFMQKVSLGFQQKNIGYNILLILWILRLNKLPKEIRFFILNKLAMVDNEYASCAKLCAHLYKMGHDYAIVLRVNKQAKYLKQILGILNAYNSTPLQALRKQSNLNHKAMLEPLFDGTQIDKDLQAFNGEYPAILRSNPENLICKMHNDCMQY